MYVLICLSNGLCSEIILFNNSMIQSRLRILINWYSHEFMFGLIVIISANNILVVEILPFLFIYCVKCRNFLVVFFDLDGLCLLIINIFLQCIDILVVVLLYIYVQYLHF